MLEADYRHPRDNTKVGLFYSQLPNGEERVSRIFLWEHIPVIGRAAFDRFVYGRYGVPTTRTVSQGHRNYLWSQARTDWSDLQRSLQCMMDCLHSSLVGSCGPETISREVFMSGGFNINMPGQLVLVRGSQRPRASTVGADVARIVSGGPAGLRGTR